MTEASVCIPNIGPQQRRRRLLGGLVGLAIAAALAVACLAMHEPRAYRAIVFLPFFAAATGFFQAREKTCIALVAQGQQNLDGGAEAVKDDAALLQMRAQARKVYVQSVLSALLASLLIIALP